MQSQLDEAKDKYTEAERDAKSAQELLEEERTKTARLEKEVEVEKKRAQQATDRMKDAEDTANEREKELMKEQKKRDRTQNSQEHLKGEVEKKNRETNKYMRENKMLERRNTELRNCTLCPQAGWKYIRVLEYMRLYNITSFYGSSCANNGKDALNTPDMRYRLYIGVYEEELKKLQEQFKEVDTAVVGLDKEKRLWGIREGDLEGRVEEVEQERNDLLAQTEELTVTSDNTNEEVEQERNDLLTQTEELTGAVSYTHLRAHETLMNL
eukprot:1188277-Prorocentrum_minimum.AAC.3